MSFRLDSLGLKLNLALLFSFLIIGGATAAFVFFGFNRTRDNASDRSQEALEQQGARILSNLAFSQSDLAAIEMEWASEIGHRASRYLEQFKQTGTPFSSDVSRLVQTPEGLWYDPEPGRLTDVAVPNFVALEGEVLDDIAYSAALDALLPSLLEGFPGELSQDAYHPSAIAFLGSSGMARYYPPIGIHQAVPADIDTSRLLGTVDREQNPERKTVWSTPYQDEAGRGLVITASTPVYEGDVFRGAFQVDLLIGELVDQVNGVKPTDSGFAFYVDTEGLILRTSAYDLLNNEVNSQQNDVLGGIIQRMSQGEFGIERIEMGGREFFLAFSEIGGVGGGFAVVAPIDELTAEAAAITAEIDEQADQTMLYVLASLTALFAVALIAATYLNRRVLVRPIEALAAGTRAVAQGDFDTQIDVRGDDELAALGHSFNQMTAEIQRSVREREAAQEELRALFAAMTDAVVVINKDGLYLRVPETNAPPILMAQKDLPGKYMQDVMPPGQADEFMEVIRKALSEQRTATVEYPLVIDERTYWFSAAVSPVAEGEVVVVARDITDRVAARQELERQVEERTRELMLLLTVSRNIGTTLELSPLLNLIVEQLKEVADFSRCSIFELHGETMVTLDSRASFTDEQLSMTFETPLLGPIWERMSRGESVIVDDVHDTSEYYAQFYRAAVGERIQTYPFQMIHSALGVPLISKDRVIGVLVLTHIEPNFYNARLAELVAAIATQIAVAIENARLYEQAQQLAAVEERQRLARELHDSVSQALYGIALGARTARTLIDRDPAKAAEPVDYVLSLAEAGLAEMRALIFELRPESLEIEGLVAALDKQVSATAARYGIEVASELSEEPEMDLAQKEIFYRIGQEALHNVVKHSRAKHARVLLHAENGAYVLEVGDDGVGFDTGQSFPGHMGLVSMSERASSIGAQLEVESRPGEGTTVKLRSTNRPQASTE